jgi:hypothetical protein
VNAKGILMHIDTADEIAVETSAALAARPSSAFGLVFVPTLRTPARCPSFGPAGARDAGLLRFVRKARQYLGRIPTAPCGHCGDGHCSGCVRRPTRCLIQKSMTARLALCLRSRTRRSLRRQTLFFARCSFFQLRECFRQRLCFLESRPSCPALAVA